LTGIKKNIVETAKLAYPVSIGQLGHVMLGVVDSLMVGKIGSVPLAASSLVNGIFFLILVLGIGLSLAITPLVAIARGGNKNEECGIVLRQALIVNIVFAFLLVVATYLTAELLKYLDQPPEVADLAESYMKIISFSIIPFMLFQTYRQFIEGLAITKPPMVIAIVANLVNILANWIFIYGNLGAPALGLDGAGIATLSTRTFMGISLFLFVITSNRFKEYDPSLKFRNINFPVIKKILSIGLPSGFMYSLEIAAFSFAAIMIGWLGSSELAAHQIAISIASVSYMIILGISSAATIRVGHAFGKKSLEEIRSSGYSALIFAASLMALSGIIFILFRNLLPIIFINETDVIALASALIVVAAFFQISDGTQAVGIGVLRGITDVKVPMFFTFISYWMIGIPVGYLLGFILDYSLVGIWIGLLLGLTSAAVLFGIRFKLLIKRMELTGIKPE